MPDVSKYEPCSAVCEEKQCCIGAFDTPNLKFMAVIRAAEKREEPVIIQHAQLHEREMPIHIIGPIMVRMAKEAKVPVCVMPDHGETRPCEKPWI